MIPFVLVYFSYFEWWRLPKRTASLNEAVQIATTEALTQILRALSPDVLMRRFSAYRRPGETTPESADAWAWNMYKSYYGELTSDRQKGFEKLFWEIFDQAYDRKLREKQLEV